MLGGQAPVEPGPYLLYMLGEQTVTQQMKMRSGHDEHNRKPCTQCHAVVPRGTQSFLAVCSLSGCLLSGCLFIESVGSVRLAGLHGTHAGPCSNT